MPHRYTRSAVRVMALLAASALAFDFGRLSVTKPWVRELARYRPPTTMPEPLLTSQGVNPSQWTSREINGKDGRDAVWGRVAASLDALWSAAPESSPSSPSSRKSGPKWLRWSRD